MRQSVGGVKEPWWRPMLRCPCFWGEGKWPWHKLCIMRLWTPFVKYREWRDGPWIDDDNA